MYEDRIQISSPGGLPTGILRNPIIAGVFNRLNIIEKFGTGIARIKDEYSHSIRKPDFDVSENRIRIILPVVGTYQLDLSQDERSIYNLLKEDQELYRIDIDQKTGFKKSKTIRILNNLADKNVIVKNGSGPAVKYKLSEDGKATKIVKEKLFSHNFRDIII